MGEEKQLDILNEPDVNEYSLQDDGNIPNNPDLPLLVYKNPVNLSGNDPAYVFEKLFRENNWGGSWRNSIYKFHHYHSTAHEVLGIYSGGARVQLGGMKGISLSIHAGDVIIIPAGVAHKNLGSSADFGVVGAYPTSQSWDMNYGKKEERSEALGNIAKVPMPKSDPVYGKNGPLIKRWGQ